MPVLQFVASKGPSSNVEIALEDIPADVKQDVEDAYKALKVSSGRFHVEFETETELSTWLNQVKAYCLLRPEGQLRYRKSPVAKQNPKHADFKITDMQTDTEKTTEAIRDSVDEVKTAAKTPAAKR